MAWYDSMSLIDSSDYKLALNALSDRFVFTPEIIVKAPKYSCYYDLCMYNLIFQNETTNSAKIVRPRKRPQFRFGLAVFEFFTSSFRFGFAKYHWKFAKVFGVRSMKYYQNFFYFGS